MRATVSEYEYKDAKIRIELDTGGGVGSNHVVFIHHGDPETDGWAVTRWFYYDEYHEQYARNFAEKIVDNDAYREQSIADEAEWAIVSDWYETAARDIYQYFLDAGVMGYTVGNDEEEQEYREAKDALENICKELFTGIKDRVRSNGRVDEDGLESFVEEKKDEAWVWLSENGYTDRLNPDQC